MTMSLPLAALSPHPRNVRRADDATAELADSIRAQGILQPLLVVPHGDGWRIIAGHRRAAAAVAAGLEVVPCIVREMDEATELVVMASENLQRENLSPIEEALIFDQLATAGLSRKEIAARLGIGQNRVETRLSLLKLAPEVQQLVHTKALPLGGALALTKLPNVDVGRRLAVIAARGHWSEAKLSAAVDAELKHTVRTTKRAAPPLWKKAEPATDAAPSGQRRAAVFGWLERATGAVDFGVIAQAAKRSCDVCGMADSEAVCADCPMLELLAQLEHVARGQAGARLEARAS